MNLLSTNNPYPPDVRRPVILVLRQGWGGGRWTGVHWEVVIRHGGGAMGFLVTLNNPSVVGEGAPTFIRMSIRGVGFRGPAVKWCWLEKGVGWTTPQERPAGWQLDLWILNKKLKHQKKAKAQIHPGLFIQNSEPKTEKCRLPLLTSFPDTFDASPRKFSV